MITITSGDGSTTATYLPEANMLCASLTVDGVERLDVRKGAEQYAHHGSTMAVPLLYPWANRLGARSFDVGGKHVELPDDPSKIHVDGSNTPIHGVTPALMTFQATKLDASTITGTLDWTGPELLALFPFPHRLQMTTTVEHHALMIATTVSAAYDQRVPVSFGFHPYLQLVGAPREEWSVELPACNALALDERMLPTGKRTPHPQETLALADHAFDNAYELAGGEARFAAATGTTTITVDFLGGYGYGQVYSPADAQFVCFEPMTAPGNALVTGDGLQILEPGELTEASFRVSV